MGFGGLFLVYSALRSPGPCDPKRSGAELRSLDPGAAPAGKGSERRPLSAAPVGPGVPQKLDHTEEPLHFLEKCDIFFLFFRL